MEVSGRTGGHGRARAITSFLYIGPSWRVDRVRTCPRVLRLSSIMTPSSALPRGSSGSTLESTRELILDSVDVVRGVERAALDVVGRGTHARRWPPMS